MPTFTEENAPMWRGLIKEVSKDKPSVGKIVQVEKGKHKHKIGKVLRHQLSQFERPFRYGSDAEHAMTMAIGRSGYAVLIEMENGERFWTKANNVSILKEGIENGQA